LGSAVSSPTWSAASRKATVAEIAEQIGYTKPSAFFRAFQAREGQSPADYRLASSHPD
jgi:AraC-like DNA-binding protein